MKFNLQIEVDSATDAGDIIALAQLLKARKRDHFFIFDEAMPALSNALFSMNLLLSNIDNLKASIELQEITGDPTMLPRIKRESESLSNCLKKACP